MDNSVTLAKIIGSYLCIIALLGIIRPASFKQYITALKVDDSMNLIAAALAILIGLTVLVLHPVYVLTWQIVITFFGIACVLKGIAWILYPEGMVRLAKHYENRHVLLFANSITFILGAILLSGAFYFS